MCSRRQAASCQHLCPGPGPTQCSPHQAVPGGTKCIKSLLSGLTIPFGVTECECQGSSQGLPVPGEPQHQPGQQSVGWAHAGVAGWDSLGSERGCDLPRLLLPWEFEVGFARLCPKPLPGSMGAGGREKRSTLSWDKAPARRAVVGSAGPDPLGASKMAGAQDGG